MKAIQKTPMHEEVDNLTIPEAEEIIEEALEELSFSTDPGLSRALRFLAPPGYQAIVELCGENGRSKRRNANADSWTPEEDEVRIYFERAHSRRELVLAFLSVLELVRTTEISLIQRETFGEIIARASS